MSKPSEARVGRDLQRYNEETGARMVAGCICLNESKDKLVMILSSSHEGRWVLPKGGIELDETDDFAVTAARETWEEAGVEGKITKKLPIVLDSRGKKAPVIKGEFDPHVMVPKTEFHFYEMIVDNLGTKWPESHKRDRRWCTYSEAKHELTKSKRPELIEALNFTSIIRDGIDGNEDDY